MKIKLNLVLVIFPAFNETTRSQSNFKNSCPAPPAPYIEHVDSAPPAPYIEHADLSEESFYTTLTCEPGYRLSNGERSMTFSCDTGYRILNEIQCLSKIDLLFRKNATLTI